MSKTDKDNPQKGLALRFCVASGAVPYLEVPVSSALDFTPTERLLTDIDVLGVRFGTNGDPYRSIFDCKSNGPSPINRAFWLAGLMRYVDASDGFVILGRRTEKAHRLSARKLDVHIFDSSAFSDYAAATDPSFPLISTYSTELDAWHELTTQIAAGHPSIRALYGHLLANAPLGRDPARRLRRILAVAREHRGELDPSKPYHRAIVAELALAIAMLLVPIMGQLRNVIDLRDNLSDFSTALRYFIWGGREGVATLQRMQELRGEAVTLDDFENGLLAWPNLIQLTRLLLEAPTIVREATMPLRELVFRQISTVDAAKDRHVSTLLHSKRAKQFAVRIVGYTIAASKLPREFADRLVSDLDALAQLET